MAEIFIPSDPPEPIRIVMYSHDTFGLGNLRRILSICHGFLQRNPRLSILLITGSPMIQSFRIPPGIDYVKLPCLTRRLPNVYVPKFLKQNLRTLIKLRSKIILSTIANFRPHLFIVDKKPLGIRRELAPSLAFIREQRLDTKLMLLLRDILDRPSIVQEQWETENFHQAIESFYDQILVLGHPEVFDPRTEYAFPLSTQRKVRFCGYLTQPKGEKPPEAVRAELGIRPHERFILLTAGGGEDGIRLFQNYLDGLPSLLAQSAVRSLLVCGPEMPPDQQRQVWDLAAGHYPSVTTFPFTDDLMSYIQAADLVVSMAGYSTVCELLSAQKPAILVPRVAPVEEQWIRATRLATFGHFTVLHPDQLAPEPFVSAIIRELATDAKTFPQRPALDLNDNQHLFQVIDSFSPPGDKSQLAISAQPHAASQ